jgi:hypothetical protein
MVNVGWLSIGGFEQAESLRAPLRAWRTNASTGFAEVPLEALLTRPVLSQALEVTTLGRVHYPRPFIASAIQHTLTAPWATEFFILPYWFFFLSLGLVTVWLVVLYVQVVTHSEARLPRRETRGFSRAQAGDALTSVVPLAWSISMLMHASVHSFNFDDNTAETVFSFNVLAYQWG